MNKNTIDEKSFLEIVNAFKSLSSTDDIKDFMLNLFTDAELATLSKRWRILKLLSNGYSQRAVAKELNVGLCKVTRGAKILKKEKSIVTNFL